MIKYALSLLVLLSLFGCENVFEDRYRYPCQDPENFKSADCKPPICEADGSCTKYLLDEKAIKTLNSKTK